MSNRQNVSEEKRSAEDRALDRFADMLITKLEGINADWKKPWFTEGAPTWPKNLDGREYNGMNSLVLMMHCEKEGYKLPVFMTFDRVAGLNYKGGRKTGSSLAVDKDGNALPQVSINKGEKSFPVFLTTFTVVDPETKEKIPYDDYKQLSAEERSKYHVFPKLQVYNVFNVAQTNIEQARPELFKKLQAANGATKPMAVAGEQFAFPALDHMIEHNEWICPIKPTYGDDAYYSISKAEIVIPEKRQFKSGESFYSNLAHEMAHSTGAENQLNRLTPTSFGSKEYAREELVAELSAALVSQRYGMDKCVKEDSIPYLKNWLNSLKEDPAYIKTVLVDVKKASSMITQRIEVVQQKLDTEQIQKQEQGNQQSTASEVYDIPKWAVPLIVNGDSSGLSEKEIALVDEFLDKNFPDGFIPEVEEGLEKEFNLYPAFGERNENALPNKGESPYLAVETVSVRFSQPGYMETLPEGKDDGYNYETVVDNTKEQTVPSEETKKPVNQSEATAAKQASGSVEKFAVYCASVGSYVNNVTPGIVDFNSLEKAMLFDTRNEAKALARICKTYVPELRFTAKSVDIQPAARLSDLIVEQRGEQRTPWLSGKVDGEPVVSEQLTSQEYQDYLDKKVSVEDLGLIHFKHYLDQREEERMRSSRQL